MQKALHIPCKTQCFAKIVEHLATLPQLINPIVIIRTDWSAVHIVHIVSVDGKQLSKECKLSKSV